ncbi:SRPBCC family protein [Streptomyces sp. SM11]|uniref:SRPBCC family protein n=1 Tax=Streptomyces sp. SM11 TaxID=565557 RepID=UPI000CD5083F|nr:SRPBCC family protein [Streptomyces sp. SM11]
MTSTTASTELPVSADRVWQLIGGFGSLPDWLPYIPASELSEGGRVRTLVNEGGGVIVERLEAFDNASRSCSILRAPFPVTGYLSTIAVREGSAPDRARVEWSGTFTPDGIGDDEAAALFHGVSADGVAALTQSLAG